jgi:thiamine monophosphate synthase
VGVTAAAACDCTRDRVPPLYAIADADLLGLRSRARRGRRPWRGRGIDWIQVRVKRGPTTQLARAVERSLAELPAGVTLWIDDRADVAALYRLPACTSASATCRPAARAVVGESCWIGCSTHDLEQVRGRDATRRRSWSRWVRSFPTRHKEIPIRWSARRAAPRRAA